MSSRRSGIPSRTASLIAAVVSAACFGTLAILVPLAYKEGIQPLPLLAWRFALACILLAAMAFARDRASLRVDARDLARFVLLAFTGYGAASLCFAFALKYADASVVAVLLYAYPAIVLIAGWAGRDERFRWSQAVAVCAAFVGCVLVTGAGGSAQASWPGVLLGLGAAVSYAAYTLLLQRWLPGKSRLSVMAYMFGLAVLPPGLASLLTDGPESLSPAGWTATGWMLLAAIVAVPTFAAVVLYLQGIRGLGASQAALASAVEPIFTMLLAAWILRERLGQVQLVGAALVILGISVAEMFARRGAAPAGP